MTPDLYKINRNNHFEIGDLVRYINGGHDQEFIGIVIDTEFGRDGRQAIKVVESDGFIRESFIFSWAFEKLS